MRGRSKQAFHGWRVAGAAFVLAAFGWGLGFYGPPVYLSVVRETRGWSLALISTAMTAHFLIGAGIGAALPTLHARFGAATVTRAGALSMALGINGWAIAASPWQLFAAAGFSGIGWGCMSAAAINAIIAPWFSRNRPAALAMAYNGGSIGGVIFSPLWVAAISLFGFPQATLAIGLTTVLTIWILASLVLSRTPGEMGLAPDGDDPGTPRISVTSRYARPLPGRLLWRNGKFLTLVAGMALGLFAQIGLVAHLFSLLTPALGAQQAGLAMGLVTALAIAGRTLMGWLMPPHADRRLIACAGYALQCAGSIALIAAGGTSIPLLLLGIVLFGAGFGNATSLPPLIAQVEFTESDVARAVSLIVAIGQAAYAFAPAAFGLIRSLTPEAAGSPPGSASGMFAAAAIIQALAIAAFLVGRRLGYRLKFQPICRTRPGQPS